MHIDGAAQVVARLSAYTEVSAAVHDQPSEDVDDQVPPLQAYRDQTTTVVPY